MADFNLKPLEDRIVVKAIEGDQTTASGLVIPDTAKEKPQEGEVVAVGPGRFEDGAARAARRRGGRQGHLLQVRRHRGQGTAARSTSSCRPATCWPSSK